MERRAFLKNVGRAGLVAGAGITAIALGSAPAEASVSVHAQATVKGLWPSYHGICPCGWHGPWHSWDNAKHKAWNDVDGHKLDHGIRP